MIERNRKKIRLVGLLSLLSGIFVLSYYLSPLVSYEIEARTKFYRHISPIPEGSTASIDAPSGPIDYTRASNWFAGDLSTSFDKPSVNFYTITIEKLGIKDAPVALGGDDLSESLIQYPGTAPPGRKGNSVVFGHSILPRFYDPTDPMAIFSTLNELEEGDEIEIAYDGVQYKYVIDDMFEVKPTDLYILDQEESESTLSLVTCTPPGHPLRPKRLVVKARMVPFNST